MRDMGMGLGIRRIFTMIRGPREDASDAEAGLDGAVMSQGVGSIDRLRDGWLEGWVIGPDGAENWRFDLRLDGEVVASDLVADLLREDVLAAGHVTANCGFSVELPPPAPGRSHVGALIELVDPASGAAVISTQLDATHVEEAAPKPVRAALVSTSHAAEYEAQIDLLDSGEIKGWATRRRQPEAVFELQLLLDGLLLRQLRNDQSRHDLQVVGKSAGLGGFSARLPLDLIEPGEHELRVVLPDGRSVARRITTEGGRQPRRLSAGVAAIRPAQCAVIVPIFNAADDLEICIARLARFTPAEVEILLIDDASDDERIGEILSWGLTHPGMRVLRNEENAGFTRTINRGLAEIGRKHAILLNSDARVTPGWLTGMLSAAASRARVATVTAMSDRAGAFSAPRIGDDNPLPPGVDEITYARAFRARSLGLLPVVPTGNGFCMFVNRACIDEIDSLDAVAFPRGYGEENDFCMRAGRAGWFNLIDDRTYVFHDRSKSFGDAKADLLAAGAQVIAQRYPEYQTAIRVFHDGDEIALARHRAALAAADCIQPDASLPNALFVVPAVGGGTPLTNMDLMSALVDELRPWLLVSDGRDLQLSRLQDGVLHPMASHQLSEPVDPISHRSGEYDAVLRDWLEQIDPEIVHIRHIALHSLSLPALARERGARVVFSFHDFYTLCPNVKLLDETGQFCAGSCTTTEGECRVEIWPEGVLPPLKHGWVNVWRARFAELLRDVEACVTTSESAALRLIDGLGLDPARFHVIPHGRDFPQLMQLRANIVAGEPVRVLLPGSIGVSKGRDLLASLIDLPGAEAFEFHVLGAIAQPGAFADHPGVVLHGAYERDELAAHVAEINPHLGAVFSIWDETWCHTLTELWSLGLPAAVFDFPTVAGRVRAHGAGWVLPQQDPEAVLQALLDVVRDPAAMSRAVAGVAAWQASDGVASGVGLMAARYRELYRHARGVRTRRPVIARLGIAGSSLASHLAEARLAERCRNDIERAALHVAMAPEALLVNLQRGHVQAVLIQGEALMVPEIEPLLTPLIEAMSKAGAPWLVDLGADTVADLVMLDDSQPLWRLLRGASAVTVATEAALAPLAERGLGAECMPDRLSERLWRGPMESALPEHMPALRDGAPSGEIRVLMVAFGDPTAAIETVELVLLQLFGTDARVSVALLGDHDGPLPSWLRRIEADVVPGSSEEVASLLKSISAEFDFGLVPLWSNAGAGVSGARIARIMGGLGLPVLCENCEEARELRALQPGLEPVEKGWLTELTRMVAALREGRIDREAIRAGSLRKGGMGAAASTLDGLAEPWFEA